MRCAEWRGDRLKVTQLLRVAELGDAFWVSGSYSRQSPIWGQEAQATYLLLPIAQEAPVREYAHSAPVYTHLHLGMHTWVFCLLMYISCVCMLVCKSVSVCLGVCIPKCVHGSPRG